MSNTGKGIAAGAAVLAAVGIVVGVITYDPPAASDPSDVVFVLNADREILRLEYNKPHKQDPAWAEEQVGTGAMVEPCSEDQREAYSAAKAADESAWQDYEQQVEERIRQLAVDSLAADGIDPPEPARRLYLDKGKITDKKPTAAVER